MWLGRAFVSPLPAQPSTILYLVSLLVERYTQPILGPHTVLVAHFTPYALWCLLSALAWRSFLDPLQLIRA